MSDTLLEEFKKYENIKNDKEIDISELSPTIALLLICSRRINIENIDSVRKIEPDSYIEFENEILNELNIPKFNVNTIYFVFHELTSNIYDHSKFSEGYIIGKSYGDYTDISFIDNGINIANSLRNANFSYDYDFSAILEAINGLSTKNELGFIERGTGLNNTINLVTNGCEGSVLICSGNGLVFISKDMIRVKDINKNPINGTLISLKMKLKEKVDIYNYLNHVTYI